MSERASKESHLAAALEVFDQRGPAPPSLWLGAQGLAELAEVHRSTLYRHWETAAALNADLDRWGTLERPGWQARLVAADPATSMRSATVAALRTVTEDFRFVIHAAISSCIGAPGGRGARRWERAWLDALAWWIAADLRAAGRRPLPGLTSLDLALAVASAVDGPLVLASLHGGPRAVGWEPHLGHLVAASASRLVRLMSTTGTDPCPDVRSGLPSFPRLDGWSATKRGLLSRLVDAVASAPDGHPGAVVTGRLVDFEVLGRRTGLSTRRLYAIWPAAADFNADLVEQVMQRHATDGERSALQAIAARLRTPTDDVADLVLDMAEAIIVGGAAHGCSSPFGCLATLSHPVARRRAAGVLDASVEQQRLSALAMLQTFGYDLRPPLDVDGFTWMVFGGLTGAQRIAVVHPDLLARRSGAGPARRRSLAIGFGSLLLAGTMPR